MTMVFPSSYLLRDYRSLFRFQGETAETRLQDRCARMTRPPHNSREIEINYEGLDRRVFLHSQRLSMTIVDSFGKGVWISPCGSI